MPIAWLPVTAFRVVAFCRDPGVLLHADAELCDVVATYTLLSVVNVLRDELQHDAVSAGVNGFVRLRSDAFDYDLHHVASGLKSQRATSHQLSVGGTTSTLCSMIVDAIPEHRKTSFRIRLAYNLIAGWLFSQVGRVDHECWCRRVPVSPDGGVTMELHELSFPRSVTRKGIEGVVRLHGAAAAGHDDCVIRFLQAGVCVHGVSDSGRFAMHLAAENGHTACVDALMQEARKRYGVGNKAVFFLLTFQRKLQKLDTKGCTALFLAAANGRVDCVRQLANAGAPVSLGDNHRTSPLQIAAANGHLDCVRLLHSLGARVDCCDKHGVTAFHAAARCGRLDVLQWLAEVDPHGVTRTDTRGATALHHAARSDAAYDSLCWLIEVAGETLRGAKGAHGEADAPAFFAASLGQVQNLRRLLEYDDRPLMDGMGRTLLHVAAAAGHASCVELLLDRNACVGALDKRSATPMHAAAEEGHTAVVQLLWSRGGAADQGAASRLLHCAVARGHLGTVEWLIARGADVNSLDLSTAGNPTSVVLAALAGHLDCLKLIVASNADLTVGDTRGRTALHYAAAQDSKAELLDALLRSEGSAAAVNQPDEDGRTPLHFAVLHGRPLSVAALLAAGADPWAADRVDGSTAVDYAVSGEAWCVMVRNAAEWDVELRRLKNRRSGAKNVRASQCLLAAVEADSQLARTRDLHGRTLLHRAVCAANVTLACRLVDLGVAVDAADPEGFTAVHFAVMMKNTSALSALLERGAQVNGVTREGFSVVHLAVREGFNPCLALLRRYGATLDAVDHAFGQGVFHAAVLTKNAVALAELLRWDVDGKESDRPDRRGWTPLHHAVRLETIDLACLLVQAGADVHKKDSFGFSAWHWVHAAADRHRLRDAMAKAKAPTKR